jgi:hypothetical protein
MNVLDYLKFGFHIFPIKKETKIPLTAHGFKDASNDIDVIMEWLARFPNCGWAVATGASGLIVVDFDTYKEGALGAVAVFGEELPPTWTDETPSGGTHHFFKADPKDHPKTSISLASGVDVLSRTGYVLIAPSSLDGKSYKWRNAPGGPIELADAPPSLLKLLRERGEKAPAPSPSIGDVKELFLRAGDGRWNTLQRHAGSLRAMGWNKQSIFEALKAFAKYQCEPDESISGGKLRGLVNFICTKPPTNLKNPTTKTKLIKLKIPDGRTILVKQENLQEALSRGAVLLAEEK